MNVSGLPARLAYAVAAIPAAGAAGFYSGILLLPRLEPLLGRPAAGGDDAQVFVASIFVGALVAFTASLLGLTLPWRRHRKRRGRPMRAIISTVIVFFVSLSFAQRSHALALDIALVLWLAYTLTFTFVRYGVLDQTQRRLGSAKRPSSVGTSA